MTRILVTGGAGFIGSHLCSRLAELGHEVCSLDNYFTGSIDNHVSRAVTWAYGDTRDIAINRVVSEFNPEVIYHLGEYARVEQSFADHELVWSLNTNGTYAVLEFARKHDCKLIYAGSSTKFATRDSTYIQSPYAWTKAKNTELVMNYGKWFGLDYAITYFYNVYGPRELETGPYATLIAKYTDAMRSGKPLGIVAPGTQARNFTYIGDVVDALVRIRHAAGDEYGIGHPDSYTIREVADLFGGQTVELPERRGNRLSAPVITDKTIALGWKPNMTLSKYIHELKRNNWEH